MLQTGQILNQRYRIVALIGQGGFGAVYRAWDINLNMARAVKENLDTSPEAQQQFQREAQILAGLRHPNLPAVTDYFFIPGLGQYLVMDFVEGQDLEQMRQRQGALDVGQVLNWVGQVCQALAYLHSQNPAIIHRDIKPANIKITPQGKAVLVDFGISKIYDPHLKTTVGARAITPGYSPIEQYGQGQTDARSDIYALGATLYTLLTGQEPAEATVLWSGSASLIPPRQLNPAIPGHLAAAIEQAMNSKPTNRYQTVAAFQQVLAQQRATLSLSAFSPQPTGRSPYWAVGLGLGVAGLLFLLVMVVAWPVIQQRFQPPPTVSVAALPTNTPTLTNTPTPTAIATPSPTALPTATATPSSTATPQPTATAIPSAGEVRVFVLPSGGEVRMVYVPAGTFLMGSTIDDSRAANDEFPRHTVYLDGYWIDITEVTNEHFRAFVIATNYKTTAELEGWGMVCLNGNCNQVDGANWQHLQGPGSNLAGLENHPVVNVSWDDANAFCQWRGGSLPTEAQWEKAARGTDGRIYPWGDAFDGTLLNYCDRNCQFNWANEAVNDGYALTALVGSYPGGASPYGVLDMAGNGLEWVADWYDDNYYATFANQNPTGPSNGTRKVLRGGSWTDANDGSTRTTSRRNNDPSGYYNDVGFRCAQG